MKHFNLGGALLLFTAFYFVVGIVFTLIAGLGVYSLVKEGVSYDKKDVAKWCLMSLFLWPWLMIPDKGIAEGDDE